MGKMILVCGKSASGKSTFIEKICKEHNTYKDWKVISVDDIYQEYDPNRKNKFCVWIKFFQEINDAMENDESVILETSSLRRFDRFNFISWFPSFTEYHMFWIQTSEKQRYENNQYRDRVIPTECLTEQVRIAKDPSYDEISDGWNTIVKIENDGQNFYLKENGLYWDPKKAI